MLDADALHIVARGRLALCIDDKLGHHKQADTFDAFRRTLHPRQHQMDDIFGHVVLAPGDINFGTEDAVGAVGLGLSAGTHQGQIAAGLGLSQVHSAGPLATDNFFQVNRFEIVRACGQQSLDGTIAKQRAQRKTHIGRVLHFAANRANRLGQALAAKLHRML